MSNQSQQQSDLVQNALKYAIETSINSSKLEEENKVLREQLKKNEELLNDFEEAVPRAKSLQQELKDKEAKLEKKRQELIEIQDAIISTLNNQNQTESATPQKSLAPIPMVMNRVQEVIMALTENAVDNRTTSIPIMSLFKVCDELNQLYDVLVEKGIIEEDEEERNTRMEQFIVAQQQILEELKKMLSNAASQANGEEEEEEENGEEQKAEEEEKKEEEPKPTEEEEKKEEPAPAQEEKTE